MEVPLLVMAFTVIVLLFTRALAKLIDFSLQVMAVIAAGLLAWYNQSTWVEVSTGMGIEEKMHPLQALLTTVFGDLQMPVPQLVEAADPQSVAEILMQPVAAETFTLHLLAAVLVATMTYGLLESNSLLAWLGGSFTVVFIVWLDYVWLVYEQPMVTQAEFVVLGLVAGLGAGIGFVTGQTVVEPVYQAETDADTVEPDDVLEELDI
jgi:hypothetical protein